MKDIKNEVYTCYHCGSTGLLKYIGKTGWKQEDTEKDDHGNEVFYAMIEHEDWHIFECPVCHKPVIISEYVCDIQNEKPEIKIEYPTIALDPEGVPKDIYSAFEAAVKIKGIDYSICLLSLRRVLEMICKEKGAQGSTLEYKIKDLVKKQEFPPMINDACCIIRKLGNEAAHADKIFAFANDIEQIIEYISNIINYLYAMPFSVSKMKEKIEMRK